jgi:hypothetical protein
MAELQGSPGELRFTIDVTRAATGKVETYELVGTPIEDEDVPLGDDE